MQSPSSLRYALLSNAVFSFASAVLLIALPATVGGWLGVEATLVYRVIGAGLVIFAFDLIHQATRPRMVTWRALLASMGDFSWVLGSIVLLAVAWPIFSAQGVALVGGVAAIVFAFGLWQWRAIAGAYRAPGLADGEYRLCLIVDVNAPPQAMWRVIGDLGSIQRYAPTLKSSQLEGESGGGAVRTCTDHAGKRWSEECTQFDDGGHSFTVRFVSEAPDFPFPVKTMRGGWTVLPSAASSQVMVWWELVPKANFLAPVLLPLFALRAERASVQVVQRMGVEARNEVAPTAGTAKTWKQFAVIARLSPQPC